MQFKLDGVVMAVEGTGRGKLPGKDEEGILFNALAVISYDAQAKKYKIKAYRVEGQSVDADLSLTEKGFVWGFKEPRARRRGEVHDDPDRPRASGTRSASIHSTARRGPSSSR